MPRNVKPLKIKAVLFDLGKVILHFNFEPAFRRLAKISGLKPRDIEDYFNRSGLEVLYDGGRVSSRHFFRQVRRDLNLPLDYRRFKQIWNDIFTPNPAVIKLIRQLRKRYRLVLISNTNAMHHRYIRRRYPIFRSFDRKILSYRQKVRKPDARIYRAAIRACRARPQEIFYIDDREDLTRAAESLGMQTFTFRNNPEKLIQRMREIEAS